MFENLAVIGRMNERVGLLRSEVERRGMRWGEGEVEDADAAVGGAGKVNGVVANGVAEGGVSGEAARSGRLTDEELRRQVEAHMRDEEEEGEEEDGVHL